MVHKWKTIINCTSMKYRTFVPQTTLLGEWKSILKTARKCLQIIYILKNLYLEYIIK